MGLFDRMFGKRDGANQRGASAPASSEELLEQRLGMAATLIEKGQPERAVAMYRSILEQTPNVTAQYNLGSLYAQGRGVPQDFVEGAYWFRQAERAGDEQAGKLCDKCLMDFMRQGLDAKRPETLYADVLRFIQRVYPEDANARLTANRQLSALAGLHFNRREYGPAAKLFRAAAEFGDDGLSQNYLAVLYNHGEGVEKNDLAALYWFDRAVDNGTEMARADRVGLFNAYKANLSPAEFCEELLKLADWCETGAGPVPKDGKKAAYWREMAG